MKSKLLKKCLLALGLYLFFTVIFPYPIVGNIMVAHASSVQEDQNDIRLNVKSKSLVKGNSFNLKLYNIKDSYKVTYKTSDGAIASVDDSGVITAQDLGTATVTVIVKDGAKTITSLTCDITVGPPAISVKLTKSEITLTVGSKTTLTAILKSSNTVEEALFSSNDDTIASVSPGGTVTAKEVGTTYIFASIANGKNDVCKVTVMKEEVKEEVKNSKEKTESSASQ